MYKTKFHKGQRFGRWQLEKFIKAVEALGLGILGFGIIHKKVGGSKCGMRIAESKANNSSAPSAEGKAHGVKINCCMEIIIRKGGLGDVGSTKKR